MEHRFKVGDRVRDGSKETTVAAVEKDLAEDRKKYVVEAPQTSSWGPGNEIESLFKPKLEPGYDLQASKYYVWRTGDDLRLIETSTKKNMKLTDRGWYVRNDCTAEMKAAIVKWSNDYFSGVSNVGASYGVDRAGKKECCEYEDLSKYFDVEMSKKEFLDLVNGTSASTSKYWCVQNDSSREMVEAIKKWSNNKLSGSTRDGYYGISKNADKPDSHYNKYPNYDREISKAEFLAMVHGTDLAEKEVPESPYWCVLNDGSDDMKKAIEKWSSGTYHGTDIGSYYGNTKTGGKHAATPSNRDNYFDRVISKEEFIEMWLGKGTPAASTTIDYNNLIPGTYYTLDFESTGGGTYIVLYKGKTELCPYIHGQTFESPLAGSHFLSHKETRKATPGEVKWLDNCIKAKRTIGKNAVIDCNGFEDGKYYHVYHENGYEYIVRMTTASDRESNTKSLTFSRSGGTPSYGQEWFWDNPGFKRSRIVEASKEEVEWIDSCIGANKMLPKGAKVDDNGFVIGEYYTVKHSNGHDYLVKVAPNYESPYISNPSKPGGTYSTGWFFKNTGFDKSTLKPATTEQKAWLDDCIAAGKLVLNKYDLPIGTYLKVLINYVDGTNMRIGDYVQVTAKNKCREVEGSGTTWTYTSNSINVGWEIMPSNFVPVVSTELFPGWNRGDVVVYLESACAHYGFKEGAIAEISSESKRGEIVIYHLGKRVGTSWTSTRTFRKATSEEVAAFRKGIMSIHDMTQRKYKVGDTIHWKFDGAESTSKILVVGPKNNSTHDYVVEYSGGDNNSYAEPATAGVKSWYIPEKAVIAKVSSAKEYPYTQKEAFATMPSSGYTTKPKKVKQNKMVSDVDTPVEISVKPKKSQKMSQAVTEDWS
jgi:hypothetical protein